ncbi:P-loop domain-containing protein [Methanofollis fontis]|uniref:ATPase of the ABC class C-terminal domain-containing protein n=1 Tax=Methanofollis fontis TaxID=2052832 RepID=A0A483CNH3_9EURY|nr:P-loop domain-containing protein [Methanofollis fontis]TAJ43552.1 hypothetical protein CUJ86_10505 [Methanofollis fontis]
MAADGWMEAAVRVAGDSGVQIDRRRLRPGVNCYAVRSADGDALQFCFPLHLPFPLPEDIDPRGADGAAWAVIEAVKRAAPGDPRLRPLGGLDTLHPGRYGAGIEPVTVMHLRSAAGADLWKADTDNYIGTDGLHCTVRGAVPWPGTPDNAAIRRLAEQVTDIAGGIADAGFRVPERRLRSAVTHLLDQTMLRERLHKLGLVAFIGDGTRPARAYTRFRQHSRIAGPKDGVHIPFTCPDALNPICLELPASGRMVSGLSIRRGEALAVAGSNAAGKTTLLQAILAGEDDHAPGDGRELLVTVPGARTAEAGGQHLHGADVSMFFSSLPPGMTGTPTSAFGQGSGSMTMAMQVGRAVREEAPLLLIDEDRAAANLLVHSTLQEEDVTPLSEILSGQRHILGNTTLVLAASSLDPLIAQSDRILVLRGHRADAISPALFRGMYRDHLNRCLRLIGDV